MASCGNGVPLGAFVSAGQDNEAPHFEDVLESVVLPYAWTKPRFRPERLAGDKAYSAGWIRERLARLGILAVIPKRLDERLRSGDLPFDRKAYRRRNVIERCVGWLKECRRVATRFEKLALNYLAMVKLAMIHRCLRILFSYGT